MLEESEADEFESEANSIGLKKLPRSRSMPHVYPQKLKLIPSDSIASNGSGIFYGCKDSGIVDENPSGLSVGVIPEALAEVVQGDFASGGSGMLASEPQSEVEVAEHQILGRVQSSGQNPCDSRSNASDKSSGIKLVTILNPFDKKVKELRTLKQHYYPEGGWGWVILLVTLCVQIISHGLQIALAMYMIAVPKSSVISRRLLNASFDQSGKG